MCSYLYGIIYIFKLVKSSDVEAIFLRGTFSLKHIILSSFLEILWKGKKLSFVEYLLSPFIPQPYQVNFVILIL